jgi:Uma2 family endonuclease
MPAASSPTTTTARPAAESPPETPPPARQAPPVDPGGGLYRMSLETYHRIAELEILTSKDRTVLIDGLLVNKMTKGPEHSSTATKGYRLLTRLLPDDWHIRKEEPLTLPDGPSGHPSEPEPDLAVVRGDDDSYTKQHPLPGEIALVVEVAASSLRFDREMLARYAWAGIPVVWIVNLNNRTVELYTDPTGPGDDPRYRAASTLGEDGRLPLILDGTERGAIPVRDLLP